MADSFCGFGRAHHGVSINRTPVFWGKTTQFGERLSRWKLTEMMSAELLYLRKSNHFALNQKDASRIYIEAFTSTLFYVYNVYMGENTSINTLRMINFTIFSWCALCALMSYQFRASFFSRHLLTDWADFTWIIK